MKKLVLSAVCLALLAVLAGCDFPSRWAAMGRAAAPRSPRGCKAPCRRRWWGILARRRR